MLFKSKNPLFDINEFIIGEVLTQEDFINTKRMYSNEYSFKKFLHGRYFVYYKNNVTNLLVHDIAQSYKNKYDDNALLIFIQKKNNASLVCFIDSSNTFSKNRVLIQEIDINTYENDYRKMEETILHFSTKDKRPIKVFLPNKKEETDNIELINKIFNDFKICSSEELNSFFPNHILAKKTYNNFLFKTVFTLFITFFGISEIGEYVTKELIKQDKEYLSKIAKEKFGLENEFKLLSNNEFILNEEKIQNANLKEIAK